MQAACSRRWLAGLLALLWVMRSWAAENPMPRPPELERDVQFWIRVYTEIDTNAGFLHDERNLGVVYSTLRFTSSTTPHERQRLVEQEREHYAAALRRIAAAQGGTLSEEDQHIRDAWGPDVTPARLLEAADEVRFQLGQSDRFRAGLVRSGAWETHIAEALANLGLPAELAVLPHVESSFNPAAYSKVGAAGLWQFMRSTGRRYMRIDSAVDDRLDPFRATEAAAQLLAYNYRLLGTWPLALTAYNHGAEGVRRAKEQLGTDDIVRIVRDYKSRTFGFASRNFYVSFLAALEIDRNPEKYFGAVERVPEAKFQEVSVPAFVPIASLERALKISPQKLHDLNPSLLKAVWDGQRHVPKAYRLRLPADSEPWTTEMLAQRLAPSEQYAGQPVPRRYRVRPGDTIATLADEYGVTPESLARLNRLRTSAKLKPGRVITLPAATPGTLVAAATPTKQAPAPASPPAPTKQAPAPASVPAPPPAVAATTPPRAQGQSAAPQVGQPTVAQPGQPAIAPASPPAQQAAAQAVSESGVYIVQRGESLSDIAAKVGMTEAQLLQMNGIRNRDFIFEGQQLQVIPFSASVVASVPTAGVGAGAVPPAVAEQESAEEAAAVAKAPAENVQPVTAAQAEELSPALGPAAETQQNADPVDYSVAKDGTIRVAAAETLGHYADWLGVKASRLRQINKMSFGRPVLIGHKIKLDFAGVSREEFESKRHEYHQALQASYFASHRIVGTEVYIVRRGDNLWTVTQRFSQLPIWLLQQYNPDIDLADLRPGTQVVMPRVEDVVATGA